jgi:type IV secretion system protein VirB10
MNPFNLKRKDPDLGEEDSIEGERDLTSVNKGITLQNKITNWAVIVALLALTGFLLYKYYAGMYRESQARKVPLKDITRTVATTGLPPLTMPEPEPSPPTATPNRADALPALQQTPSVPAAGGAPSTPAQPAVKSQAELVLDRRMKRELRFNLDDAGSRVAASTSAPPTAQEQAPAGVEGTASKRGVKAVPAPRFSGAQAYTVPDPNLIMTSGKVIPCTLVPAVDTTLTGIVTCITGEDATGADNKVSLMDRGTVCVGQQGGGVTHGQRRVGIIWQRCETPQHVLVPLDSGATDALGRPGVPGEVDNHFWDRFGAAVALSLISDIGPYLVASRQGNGNDNTTIAFPNILNGPQTVMGEVLRNTMDIRPTVTAPQGARVLIYLAGDIDFRDVYQLERRK